jgi:hypothetical protein
LVFQVKDENSLDLFNTDCLRKVLDFCDLKDRSSLRSSSKFFQSTIQQFPKEPKAFLVFESKLPLIKDIVRMTPLYRERELSLRGRVAGDQTDAYLEDRAKGDWGYIAAAIICYWALLEIVDIGGALKNLEGLEGQIAAIGRPLSTQEQVFIIAGTGARYFASPEFFVLVPALFVARYVYARLPGNRGENIDQSVPLMER